MLELKKLYGTDFDNCLKMQKDVFLNSSRGKNTLNTSICYDDKAGSKFVAIYIPETNEKLGLCEFILKNMHIVFEGEGSVEISSQDPLDVKSVSYGKFPFSKRVYLYIDAEITAIEHDALDLIANNADLLLVIRDKQYQEQSNNWKTPLAFISHDSRDKVEIARPIAQALLQQRFLAWYDEYSLKMGDSLRKNIEDGLKKCKKCVLILTPNYLENSGWALKEFDSIFTREMITKEKLLLPIWHNVTAKDVYEYSPSLADVKAEIWNNNADSMASIIKASSNRKD